MLLLERLRFQSSRGALTPERAASGAHRASPPAQAVLPKTQAKASNLNVVTRMKPRRSEPPLASDDAALTPGGSLTGSAEPTHSESSCLGNECALINYENALGKLWEE